MAKASELNVSVTESELLEALRQASLERTEDSQGAMTTAQLCEALGWSSGKVYSELKKLKRVGQLEVVRVGHIDLADRSTRQPAYRLKVEQDESQEFDGRNAAE